MKFTTTALALALAVSAAPAAAQYASPPPPPQQHMTIPTPAQNDNQQAPAQNLNDGNAHPSKQALKALVELQKAVAANDTANIPAKVAAAQAAATTKDDRYITAQLRL